MVFFVVLLAVGVARRHRTIAGLAASLEATLDRMQAAARSWILAVRAPATPPALDAR